MIASIPMWSLTCWWEPVQAFYKEFVTWKALRHPNVLPLLGVMMTENRFAMVSEWMTNEDVNRFVKAHPDANRFELVSPSFKSLRSSPIVDDHMVPAVGRRSEGIVLYARSEDGPWGSQGCAS